MADGLPNHSILSSAHLGWQRAQEAHTQAPLLVLHAVERHAGAAGALAVHHAEAVAARLPGKGQHLRERKREEAVLIRWAISRSSGLGSPHCITKPRFAQCPNRAHINEACTALPLMFYGSMCSIMLGSAAAFKHSRDHLVGLDGQLTVPPRGSELGAA